MAEIMKNWTLIDYFIRPILMLYIILLAIVGYLFFGPIYLFIRLLSNIYDFLRKVYIDNLKK